MAVQYDFTNGNNWSLFWNQSVTADPVISSLQRFHPIGTMKPPTTFNSPIIKVHAGNLEAPDNWRYAGRYFVKIFAGSIVSGGVPETVVKWGKFYLDEAKIIQIPPWSNDFSIEFEIPYWHRKMEITMWEYIGPNTNTVHQKLDDLIGDPVT